MLRNAGGRGGQNNMAGRLASRMSGMLIFLADRLSTIWLDWCRCLAAEKNAVPATAVDLLTTSALALRDIQPSFFFRLRCLHHI
jgi:hypothetical protein